MTVRRPIALSAPSAAATAALLLLCTPVGARHGDTTLAKLDLRVREDHAYATLVVANDYLATATAQDQIGAWYEPDWFVGEHARLQAFLDERLIVHADSVRLDPCLLSIEARTIHETEYEITLAVHLDLPRRPAILRVGCLVLPMIGRTLAIVHDEMAGGGGSATLTQLTPAGEFALGEWPASGGMDGPSGAAAEPAAIEAAIVAAGDREAPRTGIAMAGTIAVGVVVAPALLWLLRIAARRRRQP